MRQGTTPDETDDNAGLGGQDETGNLSESGPSQVNTRPRYNRRIQAILPFRSGPPMIRNKPRVPIALTLPERFGESSRSRSGRRAASRRDARISHSVASALRVSVNNLVEQVMSNEEAQLGRME